MKQNKLFKLWLLAVVMLAGSMGVNAADETYTYTTGDGTWVTENAERLYQSTNFSFLHKKNSSSSNVAITFAELRVYASHSMEVFPTIPGKTITVIEVTAGSSAYATAMGGATILAGTSSASATAVTGVSTVNGSVATFDLSGVSGCEYVKFTLAAQSRTLSWKVTYTSGSSNPTVAAPIFSPGTGNYLTTQNVTITTVTEGATIRYTTNGDEPTETSTVYTTPITVSSATTLKAKAFKAGMDASAVATATYSFPSQVANIAGFLASTETGNLIITGAVTVVYQNGSNLYVKDASGSLLVFGTTGKTFVNGDQLTGLMGLRGEYGQSPQMTNPVAPDATSGTAVNPTVFDLSAVATSDLAKYVKVENVQFTADVTFSTTTAVNGTLVAPVGFTVRDNFRLGGSVLAGKNYDIIGFISYFNGTAQLFPVSITEVATTTPSITTDPTSLDFGSVDIGAVSAVKTVTVTGTNLTAAPAYSVNNTEFSVTGTLTTAGGTLTVTYSPAAAVAGNGIITISGNGQTATVVLTGSGVLPSLSKPVATDATGISQTGFTANWNAVSGAQSYKLDVYTKTSTGSVTATDLFFSEYVEGSSNNKYLEIYNGTGSDVDLSDYKVVLYSNGSPTAGNTLNMSGILANGSTYVIKHASATLYTGTATESTVTFFNGDDAVTLEKISTSSYVDIIGRIGEDPGTQWVDATDATLKTLDKTLVRKPTVTSGVTTNPEAGFPTLSTEWISYNIDVVSNLGSHTLTNQLLESKTPVTGSPFTTTGTSLAVDGLVNTGIYFYTVTAVRDAEESPLSNEIGPVSLTATGLSNAKVDALAWTSSGKVMLNASAGEVIEIFNVAGQKVVSRPAVDGLNSVDVSAKGVVIVKVNNRISKVIL